LSAIYLPSRDLPTAACQQVTSEWWESKRHKYDLYISELVIAEIKSGDPDAAARRIQLINDITELRITEKVREMASALIKQGALPDKAQADALDIAIAAVHGVNYLLTWNCRHINNPATKPFIRKVCNIQGYSCPEICTPIEMLEVNEHEE